MYKILVFGMTENPGGVESVIMNYYHYMDKNTFHFDFLCNSYNKIAFEEEIISNGSQTFHFPARSKNYKKYKKELKNFFENNASKYDAIWVNVCSLANIDYLKMAKKYGIKRRIIHSHNSQNMDSRLRGILHKYNKKRIAYYVTDFWSCSKEASEWFYDSSIIKKSIVISNAIDVEKYCFDDVKRKKLRRDLKWEENYIIGNIGRLHFQKNQMFILDIFEKLIKKEPKVRLILIGDGEDRTKLEKEIDKKKLNKYVYMAGIQKDICGWLSTFDLFLFPSKFEGLSMIDAIVVVCIKDWIPYLNKLLYKFRIEKVKSVVPGGETGQLSIYNGLKSAKQIAKDEKSIVLIHDGVRPLINEKVISDNIQSVIKYGSAITTAKVKETILVVNEGTATIDYVPSRNNSRVAKAPQSFWLDDILKAHEKALSEGEKNCIDSCTMMQRYGYDLYLIDGPGENIKITTPEDFYTMRAILEAKENEQIYGLE